jgi:protein-S-isoprenylcysteine O-methyltransferase Ste14
MLLSCVIAGNTLASFITFVVYSSIMVFRIKEEEKLLSQTSRYKAYNVQTRWRLLPYIW